MRRRAVDFLASLSPDQLAAARQPFAGDERYLWNYRPDVAVRGLPHVHHEGLRLVHMVEAQQAAAMALLDALLGDETARTARLIMELEVELREIERAARRPRPLVRDPEQYAWSIFGDPEGFAWGWRVGGHHLALNVTVVGDEVAPTPMFLGANPANPRTGTAAGTRLFEPEQALARTLLGSLRADQRRAAVFSDDPPADVLTDAFRDAHPYAVPRGVPAQELDGHQQDLLHRLVRRYVDRLVPEAADAEWAALAAAGFGPVTFAWAGPLAAGQPHYYAIQGPTFLVEYDNAAPDLNHIHTVWRRFDGDWGEDLLARHRREGHDRTTA